MKVRIIAMLLVGVFMMTAPCSVLVTHAEGLDHSGAQPITVGAYIYPPASYFEDAGHLTGKTVEALRAVLMAMGYKPEFRVLPFKRCLEFMKDGGFPIMLPCVINDDRLTYMQYSNPVYYIDSVLWKVGSDTSKCWDEFEDIAGLRVGASNGYAYGPEWDAGVASGVFKVDMVASSNPEVIHFQKILEGRTDMFICERNLGDFIKERYAPRFDNVYPCPKSVGPVRPFCAPISRKYFEENNLDPEDFLIQFNLELDRYKLRMANQ